MSPVWAFGRDDPDEVEIGGTWLAPAAQGTAVNTEAKLLLLTHAFAVWEVQRVAICTDERNARSRRVADKLELRNEGIAERYLEINGVWEDHIRYALTREDWDERRAELAAAWL